MDRRDRSERADHYSQPYNLIGAPEWASDEEIERAIENLEAKLGYELEIPDDFDEVRMDDEQAAQYFAK